jgi:hypothetical protein
MPVTSGLCSVATARQGPFTVQFQFRDDGTGRLFLSSKGCAGLDFQVSSCASGFSDALNTPTFCGDCDCGSTCDHNIECGGCASPGPVAIDPGQSSSFNWDAELNVTEVNGGVSCIRTTDLSSGRYRISVPVYASAADASTGIGGRVVTRDFDLPATGDVVDVPLSMPATAVAACETLQSTYLDALHVAQSCDPTVAQQCQKIAPTLNIGCGSMTCPVAVNDDSALTPLQAQWAQLGCAELPGYVCVTGCRSAQTGLCGAQDGGSICDPNP